MLTWLNYPCRNVYIMLLEGVSAMAGASPLGALGRIDGGATHTYSQRGVGSKRIKVLSHFVMSYKVTYNGYMKDTTRWRPPLINFGSPHQFGFLYGCLTRQCLAPALSPVSVLCNGYFLTWCFLPQESLQNTFVLLIMWKATCLVWFPSRERSESIMSAEGAVTGK